MDDSRRFLRYVIPGVLFGLLTALWIWIAMPGWASTSLKSLDAKETIAVAFGGLFALGAFGFLFASIHHWLHWHSQLDDPILDHRPIVCRLLAAKLIPEAHRNAATDRGEAFQLSIALWHQCLKKDGPISDAADRKVNFLGDNAHGLGTARVASLAATLTTLFACFGYGDFSKDLWDMTRFISMLLLALATTYLFHDGYQRVGGFAQGIYDKILFDALNGNQKLAKLEQD